MGHSRSRNIHFALNLILRFFCFHSSQSAFLTVTLFNFVYILLLIPIPISERNRIILSYFYVLILHFRPRTPTLNSSLFGSIKCPPKTDQPPTSPCLVPCMRSLAFASHPPNFPSTSSWALPPKSRWSNQSILFQRYPLTHSFLKTASVSRHSPEKTPQGHFPLLASIAIRTFLKFLGQILLASSQYT
ncbi:hypothetical protein K435DRAFT_316944 [Dendrothele bispora CBS 962.96]|uniref:Uncharacterized protein n=1 Tax=Dendrothele bispora (strain CBS 962.96) TaxID=1314807 RepID=A0A4S8LH65_DENBC|nr:hypothetical protein K435DRAFT_316944 [Dendrothele bispora CBS 962.96]